MEKINTYEKWRDSEGVPVIEGIRSVDLMAVELKPWARKGGLGAYINLIGAGEYFDVYLCEIPPGGTLLPQRHLYEENIYILSGSGSTTVWIEGSAKQSFEWHEGSLFSPPLNAWHQHFNAQGNKPVRYVAATRAPFMMNTFHDLDFVLNNAHVFKNRFSGGKGYFSGPGKMHPDGIWETNFVPDCRTIKAEPRPGGRRGPTGSGSIHFQMANNVIASFVAEWPVGTYIQAHYGNPGGGAGLLILNGQGYVLIWPKESGPMAEGVERIKIDWHKYIMFRFPEHWFHQHFNAGKEPARFLPLGFEGSPKYQGVSKRIAADVSIKLGGRQIEYEDEDPRIRRLFKEELSKTGAPWNMSDIFPGK